ncbi:MAG: MauE/DoxX family redox-associated membrane protein [Maricaulaceae bacterium]
MTTKVEMNVDENSDVGVTKLYRMVTPEHICPFGLKAKDLLDRKGFTVEDHLLESREEQDTFKAKHNVKTTPQTFINGERIGGYTDLREYFGLDVKDPKAKTYTPIVAIFSMAALMAIAVSWLVSEDVLSIRTIELFVAISMCILAVQKLRDLDSFSNGFLGYDLLAQRHVRYAYVYPFIEGGAGVMMIAGGLAGLIAAPFALFVGTIGAWSVFKAVYIEERDIKCACVGGGSNVPLGFISLSENLGMMTMAIWMFIKAFN